MQLVFLPYHDVNITWTHRLVLVADIALLVFVGVFLWRLETSFFRAFWRDGPASPLEPDGHRRCCWPPSRRSRWALPPFRARAIDTAARQANARGRRPGLRLRVPGLGVSPDGALLGVFHRNLNVTDIDLVVDKDVTPGEPSINLRGRDLRYARLDRTDLHQADMTGANLEGASLVGADLRGVWMSCADLNQLLLTDNRGAARCVSARDANLAKARLSEARMAGIDLRGARLEEAQLDGAQLAHALMTGVNLSSARLDRADLTGAWLHGANFLLASLQGADLTGAKPQMADFTSASMQGANLSLAGLDGAVLRDAELDGANLRMAGLHGADMTGAKVQGSDLTGAHVWRTKAARRRSLGVRRHGPDRRPAARATRSSPVLGGVAGEHGGWAAQAAARRHPGGAHRRRPGRELGHLARRSSCGRASPSPAPRWRSAEGYRAPPHRIPGPAHVSAALRATARWRPASPGARWRRASRATCP